MKNRYLLASLLCGCLPFTYGSMAAAAPDDEAREAVFSYSNLQDEFAVWGTSSKETYDVAIRLNSPEMTGSRLTGFYVPLFAADGIGDVKVWLSEELRVANKLNAPDIMTMDAEIVNDMVRVRFAEPYTITDKGVYVGYSFTVTETGTQATNKPVALTYGRNPDGFYFHTSRTQVKWIDKSSSLGGLSDIAVELEGDFPQTGARILFPGELNVAQGTETLSVPVTFRYLGSDPVSSLTFGYASGGESKSYDMEFPEAWKPQFLYDYPLTVEVPFSPEDGLQAVPFSLTGINGAANPLAEDGRIMVFCYSDMLRKRPLIEEYTGLWCGWCPRGYVALERMAEENPDFIGVAIHSGDDMQTLPVMEFPNDASGLPTAWADRWVDIDPSYMNVKDTWDQLSEEFSYTAVEATADNSEEGKIKVSAKVNFVRPVTEDYAVFYYLLGNGMTYNRWLQTNYFSGRSPEDYPGMEQFIEAPEKVSGLVFNDVLLMASSPKGVAGSLPAAGDIEAGVWYTDEYEFDLSQMTSLQDFDLRSVVGSYSIVVGVVNQVSGRVSNAFKKAVTPSGVKDLEKDHGTAVCREYFDLAGRKVSESAKGLLIEKLTFSDGSVVSSKTLR